MKKIALFTILFISLIFVCIGNYKCVEISHDNENTGFGSHGGGGGSCDFATGAGCDEMQGIQVRIYRKSSDSDTEGTLIKGPAYFKIHGNYKGGTLVKLKNEYISEYNYSTLKAAQGHFETVALNEGMIKNLSGYNDSLWGLWYSDSDKLHAFISGDDTYTKLTDILTAMGYTYNYSTGKYDYVIIEPLVTVKLNNKYYTGTINALMASNMGFTNNGYAFVNYYSMIAQSFKVKGSEGCHSNALYETTDKKAKIYRVYDSTPYSKCGYNKYNLKDYMITNDCTSRAESTNPLDRISLYKECRDNGCGDGKADYKNLLNFKEKGSKACTTTSSYTLNKSCLSVTGNVDFNENNLSKYTYTADINGQIAYCNMAINLVSNVGTGFPSVISGMAYIGGKGTPDTLATVTVNTKCYLYSDNITVVEENSDPFGSLTYDSIVSNVSLGGKILDYDLSKTDTTKSHPSGKKYVYYSKTFTAKYKMPTVYLDKISGYPVETGSDNTITNYGFYSKLDDDGKVDVPFEIKLGSKAKGITVKDNGNCYYIAKSVLIGDDLNLEFRTIDTANPFIGEDGKGRKTGANWCYLKTDGTYDCSSENELVYSVIKTKNNSYNVKGDKPKYKFILTPKTITTIRNYNKDVAIDKYNTKCIDNICYNTFFEKIKDSIKEGRNILLPKG